MLIRRPPKISPLEITPEASYVTRRRWLKQAGIVSAGLTLPMTPTYAGLQPDDDITPERIATTYNNFYEFGTGKDDPAEHAHNLTTDPWTVTVSGEAKKNRTVCI